MSAQALAEQIRVNVESEFRLWGRKHGLGAFPTASIGVALISGGCSFSEVVALMDDAQHEAKQKGKNRVAFRQ
jgi:GGDEF domain-containing protein